MAHESSVLKLPIGAFSPLGFALLNDYQHGFPLHPEPFAAIGAAVGLDEAAVRAAYAAWVADGTVSRIGAVVAPRRLGASALAAMSVPAHRLEAVARRVSEVAEVNHNYEREHRFNLWFVVTAASAQRLRRVVADIEADSACAVIVLPLEEAYHLDLGFDLATGAREAPPAARVMPDDAACALPALEQRLMSVLQAGLPLERRPFAALGREAGLTEGMVLELIERWLADGLLKRFGVVVRHRELGYGANAMCVWDVPDACVGALGRQLAAHPAVTLCYRRRRALPQWSYNLFCMIHGREREAVVAIRDRLASELGLDAWPHAVLFSRRRFKQQGACYLPPCSGPARVEAACHG